MKKTSVALPVIALFFLNALTSEKQLVPIVVKRIKREVFLFCTVEHKDEEFEKMTRDINPKIINSSEAIHYKQNSEDEEGIFICKSGEGNSEAFKTASATFKPLHISITHNTENGDKISLEWINTTWQIFEKHQNLPNDISLEKIFF